MLTQFKNRLLLTSLALAAAGILTCVACAIDVVFPRGSLLAFLGWMVAAAIAIAAIMIGFAWSCEKVDEFGQSHRNKEKDDNDDWPRAVTCVRSGREVVVIDRMSPSAAPAAALRLRIHPMAMWGATPPATFGASRIGPGL